MKKLFLLTAFLLVSFTVTAQTAYEEILAQPRKAASNYYAYPAEVHSQTPAPKGYQPFYVSAYIRHGSRWQITPTDYTGAQHTLRKAFQRGVLTPMGVELYKMVDSLSTLAKGHYGELTTLGVLQHRGIARRMYQRTPQVFRGKTHIDACSTPIVRCILSMMAECLELQKLNPQIEFTNDASYADLKYLNPEPDSLLKSLRYSPILKDTLQAFWDRHIDMRRFAKAIFSDASYARDSVNMQKFMYRIFYNTANMQSLDKQWDFYRFFTPQEIYHLWTYGNLRWYMRYASSPVTECKMPYVVAPLLNNILNTADTCITQSHPGATLRFGHEVCVLPLACLMELDSCNLVWKDSDTLDRHWRNYNYIPKAANIQLIFYRRLPKDPILVKVLFNEKECHLPIKPIQGPYYDWKKLEQYYRTKLKKASL